MTVALWRIIRRTLKWRLIVLILAVGFAWHTWESAWVPHAMLPCYQEFSHDPYKEALDWQMSHPLWAGIYSGMSLGFWPSGYAIPSGCTYVNEGAGVPPWAYTAFAHAAFPAFRLYATASTFFFVWLYGALLGWALRPAPSYSMGWKQRREAMPEKPEQSPKAQTFSLSDTDPSPDSAIAGRGASEKEDSPA
ncbi:hypothetical protein [Acidithiobacillus marinus]|uniref:hypothetical protein n=1 Tax=Acidithiobacillus marinus TaxID=187490 RepID=UPI00117B8815|nr:hypothetical protein [Acidithiobacillus marinus]